MKTTNQELLLPRTAIAQILLDNEEICDMQRIGYYPTLHELVSRASGSRHWSEGEVFVFAEASDRFIVMKQVAPDSCEMLTISNEGFHDVLTAYRFEAAELELLLQGYMDQIKTAV
jgi:hypothetical protein